MYNMKILFVVDSLGRGGTERSMAETWPHLVEAGITPIVAYFRRYQQGVEQFVKNQGIKTVFLDGKGFAAKVRAVRQVIAAESPDLIHTALFESNLLGRLAAWGTPVAVMSSLVNTPYAPVRYRDPAIKSYRLRLVQMIDAWTSRYLTKHFHAVSHAAKQEAVTALGISPNRITVVERGRDPHRLGKPDVGRRRRVRSQLGLNENDEVIVNVGRHEYQKGQRYLLEAMAQLTLTHARLVLLIVGRQGTVSKELEQLCRQANLSERVRFLGHRDDVPDILAAADLFVFPTLYEGLPGAVIEAIALGLPIAASDIPPVREVVEEGRNATLVPAASASELAMAIHELLSDRNKARAYGKRSREIFEARFTLERSVSRMIELYREVAAMGKRRQSTRQSLAYHLPALSMRAE